jgi:hypothetical protein
MDLYTQLVDRTFDQPVLVMCMEGWIDAGLGAGAAMAALLGSRTTDRVVTWDADELVDHRARRPVLHLVDGISQGIGWPDIDLRSATDDAGHDMLLLVGPEPDMRWHAFAASVTTLAHEFGVRLVVGLGAFPAPVPHTRPVRLVATAPNAEMAAEVGFIPGSIDVPAGIQAVLEAECTSAGIPAVGLWARVPHYVVSMPYPAASAALVDGLNAVAGLTLPSGELHSAAARARGRIDELIANSAEHQAMVAQLEEQADREQETMMTDLPSGDELAAELERYLRGDAGS